MVRFAFSLAAVAAGCSAFAQISPGLLSDFQDGTLMGWTGPNCSWQADGGPTGVGDAFAFTTADGGGQGGKLAMYNEGAWTGNYLTASVTSIRVDMANFNDVPLEMRIVIFDGASHARWTSANPYVLPANSGWRTATFSLAESDLVRVLGSTPYSEVITNVERLMIRHDAGNPSAGGTSIVGEMGIDNILAVPEPSALLAIGAGVAALMRRRKNCRS